MHIWSDFRKLLGHMVSEQVIEVDLDKIRAILNMPVLKTEKEIKGFLVSYNISIDSYSD